MDDVRNDAKKALGGLGLLALPVVCCGGPLLIAVGISSAVAAAWIGGIVLGIIVLFVGTFVIAARVRRRVSCTTCEVDESPKPREQRASRKATALR